jgi:hypothetical protein
MPVVELGKLITGRSSPQRWWFIASHLAIAGTLSALVWVTWVVLREVATLNPPGPLRSFSSSSLWVKVVFLVLLVGIPQLLGWLRRGRAVRS